MARADVAAMGLLDKFGVDKLPIDPMWLDSYPSTSAAGRTGAVPGSSPNSVRTRRWRSRSQHWSSCTSSAASSCRAA